MTRMLIGCGPVSSLMCSNGLMAVSVSKCLILAYSSSVRPSTDSIVRKRGPCELVPGPTSP